MGAGKTTVGRAARRAAAARRSPTSTPSSRHRGRPPHRRAVRAGGRAGLPRARARGRRGAAGAQGRAGVIALGGGALGDPATRALLRERALVVWLDVDARAPPGRASATGATRPLAADRARFAGCWTRAPRAIYAAAADAILDGGAPAAGLLAGALAQQVWTRPARSRCAGAAATRAVLRRRRARSPTASRARSPLACSSGRGGGEDVGRARAPLAGLRRRPSSSGATVVVAVGGGTVTDVAGFAAATFRRGIGWIAVPDDARRPGRRGDRRQDGDQRRGQERRRRVLAARGRARDPDLLATLPPREWAAGFAEVREDGAARRRPAVELVRRWPPAPGDAAQRAELVRRCAGFKALVVAEDPTRAGPARDPQPRPHDRPRHRGGRRLRRPPARRGRGRRPRRPRLWLSVQFRGPRPGRAGEARGAARRARAADARAGPRRRRRCSRRCGTTRSARRRPRLVLLDGTGRPVWGVEPGDACSPQAVERAVSGTTLGQTERRPLKEIAAVLQRRCCLLIVVISNWLGRHTVFARVCTSRIGMTVSLGKRRRRDARRLTGGTAGDVDAVHAGRRQHARDGSGP